MEEQYQRVEPTPFEAPAANQPGDEGEHSSGITNTTRSPLLLLGLAGLVFLALIVVFALPSIVQQTRETDRGSAVAADSESPSDATNTASGDSRAAPRSEPASASSPFADAVEAKARSEAQDLLADLLELQETLTERGAESWAEDQMLAISSEALRGDELYRNRDFEGAISSYQSALDQALELENSIPDRVDVLIAEIERAIEAFEENEAQTKLELAELMSPFTQDLGTLGVRVGTLNEVISEAEAAAAAEEQAELGNAVSAWERAAVLDDDHKYVKSELARVRSAYLEQRFNAAMSEGYAALDDNRFDRAKDRFDRAARLKPSSSEAKTALQELSVARTASKLQSLQRRGTALADEEKWADAASVFKEALQIDGGLRFAREGLAEAEPRAQLDEAMSKILASPERLVDAAILREAESTLRQAKEISTPGTRLQGQIATAEDTLRIARTPIPVTIQSDGETEVTVYKVARLGAIQEQSLELRPGTYTAVGTRTGYRDARVKFTVTPAGIAPVYVVCKETI
ncbi:MAG: hypothetical protein AAF671_08555 [Pseudomonadota bacterium]